jgi:predicted DNA-binding transcriptional regulator AlpA
MATPKSSLPPVPAVLADVALISGPECAAAAGMAVSGFLRAVQEGDAPSPVIRQPRFTRWRAADVREWIVKRSEAGMTVSSATLVAENTRKGAIALQRRALRTGDASGASDASDAAVAASAT